MVAAYQDSICIARETSEGVVFSISSVAAWIRCVAADYQYQVSCRKEHIFLSQTRLFTVPIPIPYTFKCCHPKRVPKLLRREENRGDLSGWKGGGGGGGWKLPPRRVSVRFLFLMEGVWRNRNCRGNETQRNRQKSARTPQRLTKKCTIDAQLFQIHYIFKWFIEIVKLRLSL